MVGGLSTHINGSVPLPPPSSPNPPCFLPPQTKSQTPTPRLSRRRRRSMANSVPDNVTVMPHDVGSYGESIGPVDYGCVRRYRHRRLVTYLWLHGFRETLRGLLKETDALMSVAHLSQLVQHGLASLIVHDLAYKAPELKDLVLYPAGSMMPYDVLPIGFRSRRRRYVKEQDLPGPKTLTKIFLRTKKRIPSSTRSHELNSGLTDKTRKWLVDILDESLQAGSRMELQSSGKEGVPGATVPHTMSNTLIDLTKNSVSGTYSLPNAGAPVAAISQKVNLTSHAENSGISAVINAGKLFEHCWVVSIPGCNSSAQLILL
uniref:Uncharacterized protein n=1 Tax=Avena sativa TaxID=4498 RepID=A0ACD5WEA7_AVESA